MTDSLQDVVARSAFIPLLRKWNEDMEELFATHTYRGNAEGLMLKRCRNELMETLSALAAPVVSDADRRDAERYRWLKDRSLKKSVMDSRQQNGPFIAVGSILAGWSTPVDIDGAIDAAVAALSPGRSGEVERG